MMDQEKQIEEMALLIHKIMPVGLELSAAVATELTEAGYRKQSEGEWISVEESLPERNGRYLTHCNIEGQSLVCILHYSKVGGFCEGTITHWMPFPEPPKMKGGAE